MQTHRILIVLLSFFISTRGSSVFAAQNINVPAPKGGLVADRPSNFWGSPFDTKLRYKLDQPRSVFWAPLGSFLLPGIDQWLEWQYSSGLLYTSMGVIGVAMTIGTLEKDDESGVISENLTDFEEIPNWGHRERLYMTGAQLTQVAGSLSAFHAFRTAAKSHKDEYKFLPNDEDASDILLAPFDLTYFAKPTTFIPLGILLAGLLSTEADRRGGQVTAGDSLFLLNISYGAGTGEEALFRGWLMPVFQQKMGSELWSNTTTAAIFGSAHISESNPVPVAQFVVGWYLGWLTQKNNWSVKESVFVHAWWDVFVFAHLFIMNKSDDKAQVMFPAFQATF